MKTVLTATLCAILLTACATAPKPEELDQLQRVRYDEQLPESKDYILYFEAGQKVPLNLLVDGDLIDKTVDLQTSVTLNKSIYSYKEWASFDGIRWIRADKIMNLSLGLTLPGYDNPDPAQIHLKIDERKQ